MVSWFDLQINSYRKDGAEVHPTTAAAAAAAHQNGKSAEYSSGSWTVEHPYGPVFERLEPGWGYEPEPTTLAASCYCGRVNYEVRGDPISTSLCHCTGCQLLHGAPCEWVANFDKGNVRFHPTSLQVSEHSREG